MRQIVHILTVLIFISGGISFTSFVVSAPSSEMHSCCTSESKSSHKNDYQNQDTSLDDHEGEDEEGGCCGDDCGCSCCFHGAAQKVLCDRTSSDPEEIEDQIVINKDEPFSFRSLHSFDYKYKVIHPPKQ